MFQKPHAPQYMKIALDIALRISKGELQEGQKLYGRSVMAAEYGVSPETIRRAMKLLSDVEVVRILPQSGVVVISRIRATEYIERFGEDLNSGELKQELYKLLSTQREVGRQIAHTAAKLAKIQDFIAETAPFQNYEITVPATSPLLGQSLGGVRFWQATGATIIAIRREHDVVLSPGPYAQFTENDTLIMVGTLSAIEAAKNYIQSSKELMDTGISD